MSALTRPCPKCRRAIIGRVSTDGMGGLLEQWPVCICKEGADAVQFQPDELTYEERVQITRRTGICMDCDELIEGKRGWALRCALHKKRIALDRGNEARRSKEGRRKKRDYERKKRRSKAFREKRNARKRQLHAERMANDPNYAAKYRRRRQRETSITHPSYQKRLEYFRRTNGDPERAKSKREHALRRYYEQHPERPKPVCSRCRKPIPYDGRGAPPKYHQVPECNPYIIRKASAKYGLRGVPKEAAFGAE